jgi:EAL domain-containing protein (putative c-di-GMP-specific phosphodiesterase class I)
VLPLLPEDCYLAVNLAPDVAVQLAGRTSRAQLNQLDAPLGRLMVEITEHAAVQSYSRLRDALALGRERGVRIAIDDAGAGYASLHHIVELRPDVIKIDRSLIDGVAADPDRRSVVRAPAALARDRGATTVAEGVERRADLCAVRELGLHAAQGYLLARPSVDRDELSRWLTAGFPLPWSSVPTSRSG